MSKCLITGCEGFIGSHLAEFLSQKGMTVYGTVMGTMENLSHLANRIDTFECDISDKGQVQRLVAETKPDYVFHLAAQSLIGPSWEDPESTFRVNMLGTLYLLDAIRNAGLNPAIVIMGSSAEYGVNYDHEIPVKETKEFRPSSPYGVSKIGEDMLGYLYWRRYGMKIVRVRPFYITGPRKTSDVCSDFARGIVEAERGQRETLTVGNLEAVRDLTDISDAVQAMWLLAQKGKPGEAYNLCSGIGVRIRDLLDKMISISQANIIVAQDPEKMRPSDDAVLIGDNSKLRQLGWKPIVPLEDTLSQTLAFWREQLLPLDGQLDQRGCGK